MGLLDQIFALLDLEGIRDTAQIHASAISADFAADAAGAELVWHGRVGFEFEYDTAALAASFEFPGAGRQLRILAAYGDGRCLMDQITGYEHRHGGDAARCCLLITDLLR